MILELSLRGWLRIARYKGIQDTKECFRYRELCGQRMIPRQELKIGAWILFHKFLCTMVWATVHRVTESDLTEGTWHAHMCGKRHLCEIQGFSGSSAGKESACNAGDLGLIPGLGRSPGEGNGYPLWFSGLENSMDCIAKSFQFCPTLCDPIDGSPSGSPVPGILQARTLEWVAISFSNASKWKVKVQSLSHVWLLATPWTAAFQAPPSMGFSSQEYWSGLPLLFSGK